MKKSKPTPKLTEKQPTPLIKRKSIAIPTDLHKAFRKFCILNDMAPYEEIVKLITTFLEKKQKEKS